MFSLIIADDHKIVREGLRSTVAAISNIEVVAEISNGLEAISAVKQMQPDILLLDVSMPFVSALEVCVEVKRWSPDTRIIIFTGVNTGTALKELIDEGAKAIVLKSEDTNTLIRAINAVLTGKTFFSEKIERLIKSSLSSHTLTSREKQILKMVASGHSNADISKMLSVSIKTIDNHRTNLMRKLSLHSVSELMAYAYRESLILGPNDSQ